MNDAKLAFLIKLLGGLLDGSGLPVAKMDSHFDHESKVLLPHLPSTTRRCGTMWFSQFQEDQWSTHAMEPSLEPIAVCVCVFVYDFN